MSTEFILDQITIESGGHVGCYSYRYHTQKRKDILKHCLKFLLARSGLDEYEVFRTKYLTEHGYLSAAKNNETVKMELQERIPLDKKEFLAHYEH